MVPNGWKLCSLVDVTSWSSGGTPSKSNPDYWGGDVPWISAASMRGHYYSNSDLKITELAVNEKAKMAKKGTILLLVRGSMLWNKIPVGITSRRVAFNQDVKCISPKPKELDVTFLLYWFLAKENKLMGMVTGTGIGAGKLDTNDLQSLDVFLPPLPEQHKIATILGTWDKAISTTERLIDNSKQQKKALMQQLLTGKKRLLDETGKPFEGEWLFSTFSEVFKVANNKKTQIKSGDYLESGNIPIVDQGKQLISGYTNNVEKYDDIPVIIFGDHTRIVKWVDFEFAQGADGTQVLKATKRFDTKFSYYLLSNTDIPNLGYSRHMRELKEKDFKYPNSIKEQQKIALVLTNADNEIGLLEQQLADLKQEKKALMQQLLTGKRRVKI